MITFNPLIPMIAWVISLAALVAMIAFWLVLSIKKKNVNLSFFLVNAALLSLMGALLNPGIATTETIVSSSSDSQTPVESPYDVYFVIDTTSSISAEDWADGKPRLDGVKEDVASIVEQYQNARFSLISFDSIATVKVPITNDSSALLSTVNALQQEVTNNSKGSSVTVAHQLLLENLVKNEDPDKKAVVFFFSDGEQTSSDELESFVDSAPYISSGLVLGYGTADGAPMRERIGYGIPSDNYIMDTEGNTGISVIDEVNLQKIASELGVEYVHRIYGEELNVVPEDVNSVTPNITTQRVDVFGLYWIFAVMISIALSIAFGHVLFRVRKLNKGVS